MKQVTIGNIPAFTSPNSMVLICTEKPDGSTNMATLAWWTIASTNPGKIMFAINKGAYTLELLAQNKEVVVAVPGVELTPALIGCGTCSGRDTDKAVKCQLTMQEIAVTTDRFVQTDLYLRHNERLEGIHLWSPWNPALYDLIIETLIDGIV